MNFASDNAYGAMPEILEALHEAGKGAAASYGEDEVTKRLEHRFAGIFEREVAVFPVVTGTAANALSLATICPPHGAVLCHAESHIATDECGAPEFFTHGAKLVLLKGEDGKIGPDAIAAALPFHQRGVHSAKLSAVSITQLTELGTVYTPNEISALTDYAHANGIRVHMDGARVANALAYLRCTPAEMTWKAGVDVLSFGATKNGALAAEAVIFFDRAAAADFEYRRKKSGHLLSKMRFLSAQLDAYLTDERWLHCAARANTLALKLRDGILDIDGVELCHPVEGNVVFAFLPNETAFRLRAAGAKFYDWAPPAGGRTLVRLVTSFATPESDAERFLALVRGTTPD